MIVIYINNQPVFLPVFLDKENPVNIELLMGESEPLVKMLLRDNAVIRGGHTKDIKAFGLVEVIDTLKSLQELGYLDFATPVEVMDLYEKLVESKADPMQQREAPKVTLAESPQKPSGVESEQCVLGDWVAIEYDDNLLDCFLAIVECDKLIGSYLVDKSVNRAFPELLQPRERSQDELNRLAGRNLSPTLFGTHSVCNGSPIIGSDFVVESGNGRYFSILAHYEGKTEQSQRYKAEVLNMAKSSGFEDHLEAISLMNKPCFVRLRVTSVDRYAFVRACNQPVVERED